MVQGVQLFRVGVHWKLGEQCWDAVSCRSLAFIGRSWLANKVTRQRLRNKNECFSLPRQHVCVCATYWVPHVLRYRKQNQLRFGCELMHVALWVCAKVLWATTRGGKNQRGRGEVGVHTGHSLPRTVQLHIKCRVFTRKPLQKAMQTHGAWARCVQWGFTMLRVVGLCKSEEGGWV